MLCVGVVDLKNICGSLNNLGHVKGLEERNDFSRPIEFSFKECLYAVFLLRYKTAELNSFQN